MGQLIRRSMTSLAARGRPKVGARESGSGTFETCRRRPLAIAQRLQTGSPKTKLLPPQLPRGPKRSGAEPYLHHDGFVFNGERPDRQAHGEADAGEHRCTASYPNSVLLTPAQWRKRFRCRSRARSRGMRSVCRGITTYGHRTAHPGENMAITEDQVNAAQQAWCDGLVEIGKIHQADGNFRAAAMTLINDLYDYAEGVVFFKADDGPRKADVSGYGKRGSLVFRGRGSRFPR